MYNKAILMGRVCNYLELKTTPSGVPVLSFSVAVDRAYQADKQNKVTDFFNCVAWRGEAEFITRFFGKGKMILVEGELQNRKYTDKSGNERQITELIVSRACFTGEKSERDVPPLPEPPPERSSESADAASGRIDENADVKIPSTGGNDDYPF